MKYLLLSASVTRNQSRPKSNCSSWHNCLPVSGRVMAHKEEKLTLLLLELGMVNWETGMFMLLLLGQRKLCSRFLNTILRNSQEGST